MRKMSERKKQMVTQALVDVLCLLACGGMGILALFIVAVAVI